MRTKERIKTGEKCADVKSEIKPFRTFFYFVGAFIALWTIIIPTVYAADWLMERVTK